MMWARTFGTLFILAGGVTCARSADDRVTGMESCFQVARLADAICSRLPDDPAQHLDCLQKTRAAQLECLERVLSETPAGPSTPRASSEIPSGSSAHGALPESPSKSLLLKQPNRTELPATSTESGPPQEPKSPPKASSQTPPSAPPQSLPPASAAAEEISSKETSLKQPSRTESPVTSSTDSGLTPAPDRSPPRKPGFNPAQGSGSPEVTTGAISPDRFPKPAEHSPRPTGDWVVGETTSPVDYSPLVTALIRSTSQEKDAPKTLAVRCRGHRTELLVRTDGAWGIPRGGELHGGYQINDQRPVEQQWILSLDGKVATYKDDPVGLLQSVPDGARLKINIDDQSSPSHDAVFRFDGWNAVRKKIGAACKWPTTDKVSSGKR